MLSITFLPRRGKHITRFVRTRCPVCDGSISPCHFTANHGTVQNPFERAKEGQQKSESKIQAPILSSDAYAPCAPTAVRNAIQLRGLLSAAARSHYDNFCYVKVPNNSGIRQRKLPAHSIKAISPKKNKNKNKNDNKNKTCCHRNKRFRLPQSGGKNGASGVTTIAIFAWKRSHSNATHKRAKIRGKKKKNIANAIALLPVVKWATKSRERE